MNQDYDKAFGYVVCYVVVKSKAKSLTSAKPRHQAC